MAEDLVEDSTEGAASTAVASGDIREAGVAVAGMGVGAVMPGTEAGVDTAGAAGDTRAGVLTSALAGVGVLIGRAIRMRMAIPTPTILITLTMDRTRMHQATRIGITVATEIQVTTRSKIRAPGVRDHLA